MMRSVTSSPPSSRWTAGGSDIRPTWTRRWCTSCRTSPSSSRDRSWRWTGAGTSAKGNVRRSDSMAETRLRAIGVDIGVTNLKTVSVGDGEILSEDTVSTFATDQGWPARVKERIAELEAAHHAKAQTIGIAAPGLADRSGRFIAWMQGRLAEVEGLDWTKY